VKLVDQQDIVGAHVRNGFAALHWNVQTVAADVFEFLQKTQSNVDIVTANGFLHHFTAERLTRVLSLAADRAKLIVAGEPRRTHFAREVSRFVWLLGCGDVIRHDVLASIRAGFVRKEISSSWPTRDGWVIEERDAGPFSHTFAAWRESGLSQAHDPRAKPCRAPAAALHESPLTKDTAACHLTAILCTDGAVTRYDDSS
jgi:hypothetical protein